MNIKIIAESRQEEILYTPHHISYNLSGYTKVVVLRNYVIKECSPKEMAHIVNLKGKDIAYFFFGREADWLFLFKNREIDYASFNDSHLILLEKHSVSGHLDLTISVQVSFILYVEDNPRIDWTSLIFLIGGTLLFIFFIYLFY